MLFYSIISGQGFSYIYSSANYLKFFWSKSMYIKGKKNLFLHFLKFFGYHISPGGPCWWFAILVTCVICTYYLIFMNHTFLSCEMG